MLLKPASQPAQYSGALILESTLEKKIQTTSYNDKAQFDVIKPDFSIEDVISHFMKLLCGVRNIIYGQESALNKLQDKTVCLCVSMYVCVFVCVFLI